MCQFNLVFVKDIKNKKLLENAEYRYYGNDINGFSPYIKGYCNCNSFVGSMHDYDGNSFLEMIQTSTQEELQKLNKIKDFMMQINYKELKQNYIQVRDSLSNVVEQFYDSLSYYETEQLEMLEKKYTGKELQKHTEIFYKKLDNKFKEIEDSQEFKLAQQKLNEFISENKLMEESTLYYLTKEDEEKENQLDIDEEILLPDEIIENSDDLTKIIDITDEESLVIDTVIKKIENKYENNYKEFLEYKQLFELLLKNEEYILFSCVWDEPGKMSLEKDVDIENIQIENLASLDFNKMLKICNKR